MCKICGLGLDLCAVSRMEALLTDGRFLTRYFTPEEAAYVRSRGASAAQTLAGMYAAKEAVCKALGTGIAFSLKDVVIRHSEAGQPMAALAGEAARHGGSFLLSITHEGDTAAAVAVWMK